MSGREISALIQSIAEVKVTGGEMNADEEMYALQTVLDVEGWRCNGEKVAGEKNRLSTFSVAGVKLIFSKMNAGEEMYAMKIMGR